jgi:hypothetical protein
LQQFAAAAENGILVLGDQEATHCDAEHHVIDADLSSYHSIA